MENIGSIIKKNRIEKNYSQRYLAELLNISNTELSNIEKGLRKKIDPILLKKISTMLEINYEDIMNTVDEHLLHVGNNFSSKNKIEHLKKIAFDKVFLNLKEDINFSSIEFIEDNIQNLYAVASTKNNRKFGFAIYYYNNLNTPFFNSNHIKNGLEEKIKTAFVNFHFQNITHDNGNFENRFQVIIINTDSNYSSDLNEFLYSKFFFLKPYINFHLYNLEDLN